MFTYLELDDFIPDYYQQCIEDYMMSTSNWKYMSSISGIDSKDIVLPDGINLSNNQNGFSRLIFSDDLGWEMEERLFYILQPMILKVMSIIPIPLKLYRIRSGLIMNSLENMINNPHVDMFTPHYTFLYYVNDSDGDTFIFNEKFDTFKENNQYPNNFSLLKRFNPKRGNAIMFNGLHYHSSSTPVNHDSRIAININLVPIDN
jgi:hypothetical protein